MLLLVCKSTEMLLLESEMWLGLVILCLFSETGKHILDPVRCIMLFPEGIEG